MLRIWLTGRAALIADVLAGRFGSSGEILRRAQSLGTDLSAGHLVAMVVEPANLADLAERSGMTEHERQRVRLRLTAKLREVMAEHGCVCLAGIAGDRVLAVAAVPLRLVPQEVLNAAAELIREIAAADPNLSVLLGVSRATRLDSLPRAFEEAHEAVALGERSGRGAGLYHFGDLGLHHLLVRLAQGPELAAFVESELGPLLEHDARTRAVLLPTLRVYLDNACRKSDAARAMWIQRRTLYGRLSRIERLIGRSLDGQDSRTRLAVAIAGLDMLRHRVRVSGTND